MSTVRALRERGDDAVHLRELRLQTLPDDQILGKARSEHRIVLTFDLDFGDLLAASGGQTPSVILLKVLAACEDVLARGAFIVVEDSSFRVRRLPIHPEI